MDTQAYAALAQRLTEGAARALTGKEEETRLLLCALAAGGHVLLEDVPGTGKTVMAKSLAKSLDADFARIQFTPGLLPTDVTGLSIWDAKAGELRSSPARFYQYTAGRRDKSRHAPHAVGAAGVHGGAAGD